MNHTDLGSVAAVQVVYTYTAGTDYVVLKSNWLCLEICLQSFNSWCGLSIPLRYHHHMVNEDVLSFFIHTSAMSYYSRTGSTAIAKPLTAW